MGSDARIRALVVDDEAPARLRMRDLLSAFEDVEIVGEAASGDEALDGISELRPDLVFLDIQMPGRSGLEVAALAGPPRPHFVFCTAFDRFALDAFENHALDYLLKPVTRARLARAIDRVRDSLDQTAVFRREFRQAEETQARLFPRTPPTLKSLQYAGVCRPVQSVGGDYYDFLPLGEETLGIALADVSGKGVSAALLMAGVQGRLQSLAADHSDRLPELASKLNRALCAVTDSNRFVSFFYGVYRGAERRLDYVNAGHLPPFWRQAATGKVSRLQPGGPVLGILQQAEFQQGSLEFAAGDLMLLFTDGVSESMNTAGEEFGEERLGRLFAEAAPLSSEAISQRITEAVQGFRGGSEAQDDLTLIVAKGVE